MSNRCKFDKGIYVQSLKKIIKVEKKKKKSEQNKLYF